MEITEILEAFRPADGIYKREHVDAAIERQEEITPHLIQVLEDVCENIDPFVLDERIDHVYALQLLRHFNESRAHDVILRVFSLPDDLPFELYGDMVTEDLPDILSRTCGGDTGGLRALVRNVEANEYCRSAAQEALIHAVLMGFVEREEIIEFFRELLTEGIANKDENFLDLLLPSVHSLYPEELMPLVKEVYDRELVPDFFPCIGYEDFERALEQGKDATLEATAQEMHRRRQNDIHVMGTWLNFAEDIAPAQVNLTPSGKAKAGGKKKKKAKRKIAKKSKRKNRR